MPVFYFCRNIDTISRFNFYCFFSFFLIVSTSCNADKDLSASTFCMMNMPVISALNWTTPSQSPGFTGLNTIQNCVFCTLFDEVLLLSTTIYLWLISLTASKELSILLLKLYNGGAIGISASFLGLRVRKID